MNIPIRKIVAVLQKGSVIGAWLFGSARQGKVRSGSDVDLGILFDGKPSLNDLADLRTQLQSATAIEEIDVVPLNDASPILRFEALSGRRLLCRDADRCAEFASLTSREFEDEMAQVSRWTLPRLPSRRVAEDRPAFGHQQG